MARLGAFWHNWRVAAVLMCLLATKIWRLQAQQHTLDITICIALSLFSDAGGNLTMIHPALVGQAAAFVTAAGDINNLDCAVVGSGCQEIVSYPGGRIRINPVIVDLRGYEAVRAPLGTLTCIEKFQSEAIVGFLTAALVEAAALFGGHYQTPIVTPAAESPSLTISEFFPYVSRTTHSISTHAKAIADLLKHLDIRQACIMYQSDIGGQGYADSFIAAGTAQGLDIESYSLGMKPNAVTVQKALAAIGKTAFRAVVIFVFPEYSPLLLDAVVDGYLGERNAKEMIFCWQVSGGFELMRDWVIEREDNATRAAAKLEMLDGSIGWRKKVVDVDQYDIMSDHVRLSFNMTDLTSVLHDPDGNPDPRLALGAAQMAYGSFNFWPGVEYSYDAMWAVAGAFPQASVPFDGVMSSRALFYTLVIGGVFLGLLLLLLSVMMKHNRNLKAHVRSLEKTTLDIDSPLSKMLDFLKLYSEGVQLGPFHVIRGLSKQKASDLQALIIRNSHNLAAPDIQQQLQQSPGLASDITRYMVRMYTRTRVLPPDIPETSLEMSSTNSSNVDENDVVLPIGLRTGGSGVLQAQTLGIGALVRDRLCADYFMDFLTDRSPLRECRSPLAEVAQQGIDALSLKQVLHGGAEERLVRFAATVEAGYPSSFYHSRSHVADVSNRMGCLLRKTGIAEGSSNANAVLMLSAMAAAFIHDYEHPQVNNHFLVDQGSPTAEDFNDQSVSENYSIRAGLALMKQKELDFLTAWTTKTKKVFRSCVIEIVLATDMARHFELLSQFQAKIACNAQFEGMTSKEKWMAMDESQKLLTLKMAMKVSDLGHCSLPLDQHLEWISMLEEEFFAQGDREREAGVAQVSFLMDRSKPGVNNGENQVSFFNFIALPLFQMWCKAFPECMSLQKQAEANLKHWEAAAEAAHGQK